jgi:hypothetical protein
VGLEGKDKRVGGRPANPIIADYYYTRASLRSREISRNKSRINGGGGSFFNFSPARNPAHERHRCRDPRRLGAARTSGRGYARQAVTLHVGDKAQVSAGRARLGPFDRAPPRFILDYFHYCRRLVELRPALLGENLGPSVYFPPFALSLPRRSCLVIPYLADHLFV